VKCLLISYFEHDSYRLYDPASHKIFRSWDVIFEEGTGHKTLPAPGPSGEEETEVTSPAEPVTAEETALTDPRAPTTIPAIAPPAPAPCRSLCNQIPTQAIFDSQASERAIEDARQARKDWAADETTPTGINSVKALHTATNTPPSDLPDPLNYWLPNSYDEVMTRSDIWGGPITKELATMKEHSVWKVIDPPPDVRLIKTQWTFANKYNGDGNLIAQKACLVMKGFTQIPGINFFETYALVVRYKSLQMNLAITAATNMEAWQLNYIAAYLNSHPQATIHAELPDGAKVPGKVVLLLKTLYGTMDGAYNWAEALDKEMRELDYYRSKADPAVHAQHAEGDITITSTHTDNTTGISSFKEEAERAKEKLGWKYKTKDLGNANYVLGIRIDRDREAGMISISQRAYLERILEHFGMIDCNPHGTPLPPGVILTKDMGPTMVEDRAFIADKPYCKLLGSIMYAQIATQSDLSYAMSTLSKFASNPEHTHWNTLTHVLRYIKGTLHYKITYGGEYKDLKPIGYIDADYGGDLNNHRSCSGHVFIQAGGPTAWGCQYQPTEAEYMALTRAMKQILWMYSAMDEVGFPQPHPMILWNDNAGAVSLTKNAKHNTQVKYIDIRYHYIRECVAEGDIMVYHLASINNLADMFTKQLPHLAHMKQCVALHLYNSEGNA